MSEQPIEGLPIKIQTLLSEQISCLAKKVIESLRAQEENEKKIKDEKNLLKMEQEQNKWKDQDQRNKNKNENPCAEKPVRKLKKYNLYSFDFKKKLVEKIRKEERQSLWSLAKIVRFKANLLGIHQKNIYRWLKEGDTLRERAGGRKPAYPIMQERLNRFINQNSSAKRRAIIQKAREILEEISEEKPNFHFSKGWYERFMHRRRKQFLNQVYENSNKKTNTQMPIITQTVENQPLKITQKDKQVIKKEELPYNNYDDESADAIIPRQKNCIHCDNCDRKLQALKMKEQKSLEVRNFIVKKIEE